jgi:hypothetical protein
MAPRQVTHFLFFCSLASILLWIAVAFGCTSFDFDDYNGYDHYYDYYSDGFASPPPSSDRDRDLTVCDKKTSCEVKNERFMNKSSSWDEINSIAELQFDADIYHKHLMNCYSDLQFGKVNPVTVCSTCNKVLAKSLFSKAQWRKKDNRRCRDCITSKKQLQKQKQNKNKSHLTQVTLGNNGLPSSTSSSKPVVSHTTTSRMQTTSLVHMVGEKSGQRSCDVDEVHPCVTQSALPSSSSIRSGQTDVGPSSPIQDTVSTLCLSSAPSSSKPVVSHTTTPRMQSTSLVHMGGDQSGQRSYDVDDAQSCITQSSLSHPSSTIYEQDGVGSLSLDLSHA